VRASLAVPFADSRAADLRLAYGLARLPALGVHRVAVPGGDIELRVLGASHQVVADLDGARWSETVACLAGHDGALPESDEARDGALHSRFAARCHRLAAAEFAGRVRALRRRCERRPDALVGTFPGSPLAVTALVVREAADGVGWQTWHAYPQTAEIVQTTSLVQTRSVVGPR
jgi:hypothetical protein